MSVVVWDGKTLATDTQCNMGNAKFNAPKAWYKSVGGEACILSGVGTLKNIHRHKQWLLHTYDIHAIGDSFPYADLENHYYQFILVNKNGLLRYEGTPYPIDHGVNACAFGEAADFAYGALAMGATAVEAVKVAIAYSNQCGGNVESFSLSRGENNEEEKN